MSQAFTPDSQLDRLRDMYDRLNFAVTEPDADEPERSYCSICDLPVDEFLPHSRMLRWQPGVVVEGENGAHRSCVRDEVQEIMQYFPGRAYA
jgi:hypothetical protein